jgi:hypothetical protein
MEVLNLFCVLLRLNNSYALPDYAESSKAGMRVAAAEAKQNKFCEAGMGAAVAEAKQNV